MIFNLYKQAIKEGYIINWYRAMKNYIRNRHCLKIVEI